MTTNTIVKSNPRRKHTRQSQLVDEIKDLIVAGQWKPGSRLPTYQQLETLFAVSRVTMQQIISRLKSDGYVTSIERSGLFVASQLPCRSRIGLLLPSSERDNAFWRELIHQAQLISSEGGTTFEVYRHLALPFNSQGEEQRLLSDISARRLAGLLICFCPEANEVNPVVYRTPNLPRITLETDKAPEAFRLKINSASFIIRGLDWLQEQGCNRIAFICQHESPPALDIFREQVKLRKIHSPYPWQLQLRNYPAADNVTQLLLSLPKAERPDGILVGDDNLIEHVVRGVVGACIQVPDELKIVSHCNWGELLPDIIPVKYLGYNIRDMILKTIEITSSFHQSSPQPKVQIIDALFEEELNQGGANK